MTHLLHRRTALVALALVLALPLAALAGCSKAPSASNAPIAPVASAAANGMDGPYVWIEGATATVTWVIDGRAHTTSYADQPTLRLTPPAGCDSGLKEIVIDVAAKPTIEPFEFSNVKRIFAMGDIHGEYEAAVKLLLSAGVIDNNLKWAFGDGHAVFNGDVVDRGDKVTEALWLIHQLERQAREAGGRVHFVLGNHEAMILRSDLRYVHKEKYLDGTVAAIGKPYQQLFGNDSELGRWLRTKHAIVQINDTLFVHGGISPSIAAREIGIKDINNRVRWSFEIEHGKTIDPELELVLVRDGPLWHRGYFGETGYEPTSDNQLTGILRTFGAERIVVAHTHVDHIKTLYGGRVIATNLPVEDGAAAEGLMIEGENLTVVLSDGTRHPLDMSVAATAAEN